MTFTANAMSFTIPYIATYSGLIVTTQVNFTPALTNGQILQQWWSPKWGTGSNVYAQYICETTQNSGSSSDKTEIRSTVDDLAVSNANLKAAATLTTGSSVSNSGTGIQTTSQMLTKYVQV